MLALALGHAIAGLTLPRLRVSGLSSAERALASTAAADAVGSPFDVYEVHAPQRAIVFEGLDADDDEWLLEAVSSSLDEQGVDPVLVTAAPPQATLDEVVAAHEERWSLREPLSCVPSAWQAAEASMATHTELDGATVEHDGASWWDVSSVVAYDGVVDEALRAQLAALLQADEAWDAEEGADERLWERGTFNDAASEAGGADGGVSVRANGWGLRPEALEALCAEDPCPAPLLELQARLVTLLRAANPTGVQLEVCRQSHAIFGEAITPLAANAPVAADGAEAYGWHIDADPAMLPPSPWTDLHGRFPNRRAGKPRFVTALVYLPAAWRDEWGAPTRFLDPPTGEVLAVPARPGRVVLMDQDVTHAVTAPTDAAGSRPRYSLVLKLVLYASGGAGVARLADPAWGQPQRMGSAAGGEPTTRQPADEYESEAARLAELKEALEAAGRGDESLLSEVLKDRDRAKQYMEFHFGGMAEKACM